MKLSYSDGLNNFLDNIGQSGSTDTTLISFFQRNIGQRYQLFLANFTNFQTQQQKTASTVASQQYYHKPMGIVDIESCTINTGNLTRPMQVVDSQQFWDMLNQIPNFTSAYPIFLFPRRDDFGVFPVPQGVYTISLNVHLRDHNLLVADYSSGTVTVTNNSQTVTGSGVTWTSAMIGRWLVTEDTSVSDYGVWYRIADVPSSNTLTLETSYEGTTQSGKTYRIGQCPEIPEELHKTLFDGPVADYFAGPRQDIEKATYWNNMYWTGDGNNSSRNMDEASGGLLGAMKNYSTRSNSGIVFHHRSRSSAEAQAERAWATVITSS